MERRSPLVNFARHFVRTGAFGAAIKEIERWIAEDRAILDLHQTVMRDVDPDWAGRLRNTGQLVLNWQLLRAGARKLARSLARADVRQ